MELSGSAPTAMVWIGSKTATFDITVLRKASPMNAFGPSSKIPAVLFGWVLGVEVCSNWRTTPFHSSAAFPLVGRWFVAYLKIQAIACGLANYCIIMVLQN